jgi:hypothetical protein
MVRLALRRAAPAATQLQQLRVVTLPDAGHISVEDLVRQRSSCTNSTFAHKLSSSCSHDCTASCSYLEMFCFRRHASVCCAPSLA